MEPSIKSTIQLMFLLLNCSVLVKRIISKTKQITLWQHESASFLFIVVLLAKLNILNKEVGEFWKKKKKKRAVFAIFEE